MDLKKLQKDVEKMLKQVDTNGLAKVPDPFQQHLNTIDFDNLVSCSEEASKTVVNNYLDLIAFVLKKMHIRHFSEISFNINQYGQIDIVVNLGSNQVLIDFDAYVRHNDQAQTEMKMEIENLWGECSAQNVVDILRSTDWSRFQK